MYLRQQAMHNVQMHDMRMHNMQMHKAGMRGGNGNMTQYYFSGGAM
jgi:hypothetical protein